MKDWLPNQACRNLILEQTQIIRRAYANVFSFVRNLNNTEVHRSVTDAEFVTPLMDPDILYDVESVSE